MKINPDTDSHALGGDREGESRGMGSPMAEWGGVGKEVFPSPHKIEKPARYGRSVHGGVCKMYSHTREWYSWNCATFWVSKTEQPSWVAGLMQSWGLWANTGSPLHRGGVRLWLSLNK